MTEHDRRQFLKRMVGVAGAFTAPTVLSFGLSGSAGASQPVAALAQGSNVTTNAPLRDAFLPRLVAPPEVQQGEMFTVSAFDMPLGLRIKFYLKGASGSSYELGSTTAGGDGNLTAPLKIPTDAPVGPHDLEARWNPLIATTPITVLAAQPSDSAATASTQTDAVAATSLAHTGSTTDSLLSTGLGLIAAGAGAAALGARRQRKQGSDTDVDDADADGPVD